MSGILIPTDYQYDTLKSMELAVLASPDGPAHIVLLSLSPVPDSITGYFSWSRNEVMSQDREQLMKEWEEREKLINHPVQLTEHQQYGASASIVEQIVERFEVRKIIVPYSFQKSELQIHRDALNAFRKTGCEIILLPEQSYFIFSSEGHGERMQQELAGKEMDSK